MRYPRNHRLNKWIIAGAVLLVVYLTAIIWNWPFTREHVAETLHERSLRPVTIGGFRQTYFPPGCVAENVEFKRVRDQTAPPLVKISRLVVEDNYASLLLLRHRITKIAIREMQVVIPADRLPGEPSQMVPLTYGQGRHPTVVDLIAVDRAQVSFHTQSVEIKSLQLRNVTRDEPMNFNASVSVSSFPGQIQTEGLFGPWRPNRASQTPVSGKYTLSNSELNRFQYFRGTLKSTGEFKGNLTDVSTLGDIAISQFGIKDAGRSRDISAQYRASVKALQKTVVVEYANARFDNTDIAAAGTVRSGALDFELNSDRGRIEDLFRLFTAKDQSPIYGAIRFAMHARVPDGNQKFLRRAQIDGGFGVASGRFHNPELETKLETLSQSSAPEEVSGSVSARAGIAALRDVELRMPAVRVDVSGTFDLLTQYLNFDGKLMTTGQLSAAASGPKSILVKLASPLLKHENGAKVVPFHVVGKHPHEEIHFRLR